MLKDLILEICVPSFRCSAAQRMQRKIPIYRRRTVSLNSIGGRGEDIHSSSPILPDSQRVINNGDAGDKPGVKASQSAHRSLPGTVRISSVRVFSFRSCWRLLMPLGMMKTINITRKKEWQKYKRKEWNG
jgi:hypothetical protein